MTIRLGYSEGFGSKWINFGTSILLLVDALFIDVFYNLSTIFVFLKINNPLVYPSCILSNTIQGIDFLNNFIYF
jgi:hypothetical protein